MKRITFLLTIILLAQFTYAQKEVYHLLIGTYTNTGKSQGIYAYDVDMEKAVFTQKSVTTGISNPSYLVLTPDKRFVYSVNETSENSAANAYSFDKNTGKLTFINQSATNSPGPCFISVSDKHVFTANYKGGSLSVFGRNADGSLTKLLQKIQHSGNSTNPQHKIVPHVHQVIMAPDRKFVSVNDLGTDKVTVYKYNPSSTTEILTPWDSISSKPGSGPRHATFSKNGKRLYVLHEIDGTLSVLSMKKGKLSLIQETSVVKDGHKGFPADVHLSSDGKYLYATNRTPANEINCFSVAKDGKLKIKQQISTAGDGPRNFAITPDGKYLLVAHQYSNNIVIFKRDAKNGLLSDTEKRIEVGAPVCLVFY